MTEDDRNRLTAARIVERLMRDLTDRRGFSHAWDDVDTDVRAELVKTWKRLVREELKR